MNSSKKNISIWLIAGSVLVFVLINLIFKISRLHSMPVEVNSGYRVVMGTFAQVTVIADTLEQGKRYIEAAFEKLRHIEADMSIYDKNSQISMVNQQAFEKAVPVGNELFEVLKKSIEFSRLTNGAFDITVAPIEDLYRFGEKQGTLPTQQQITAAKEKTGYRKLILDEKNKTVRFAVAGMKLDLGGIAKGFAIDKALELIKAKGAKGAMVDIGGDIRCFTNLTAERKSWRIGLQDPKDIKESEPSGKYFLLLDVNNIAVTTSGNYRRFLLIQGRKFSHIIDPQKAAASKGLSSVTIFARSAADADALATAVSVTGEQKGLELIEGLKNTEAVVITSAPEFKVTKTSGADAFIK